MLFSGRNEAVPIHRGRKTGVHLGGWGRCDSSKESRRLLQLYAHEGHPLLSYISHQRSSGATQDGHSLLLLFTVNLSSQKEQFGEAQQSADENKQQLRKAGHCSI